MLNTLLESYAEIIFILIVIFGFISFYVIFYGLPALTIYFLVATLIKKFKK